MTPRKRSADDGEKVHSDAKSMPPPSSIPVKRPPQEVLPATRPNSPAPPSLAQRAEAEPAPEFSKTWRLLRRISRLRGGSKENNIIDIYIYILYLYH